jgi:hypothetical protein
VRFLLSAAAAAALFGTLAIPARAVTSSSMGTLVYYFTYDSQQRIAAHDQNAIDIGQAPAKAPGIEQKLNAYGTSGISNYSGNLSDKGTMTVDVIGQESDGGLVVNISEQGENIRRAPPATCVVYSNTNVLCDPNKTVYSEEYTLLRFLGPKFVDPGQIGADKQWSFSQNKAAETIAAKYTLGADANGMMQIGETRTIKEAGAGHLETDLTSKIGYDFNRSVPVSVEEYAQQYTDAGIGGSQRTIYQTTLKLQSDSMAKQ